MIYQHKSPPKVALLTGASRGIGHATVKKFSSEGWRIITCSRQAFDERCPWPGGKINHVQVDLGNSESMISALAEIKEKLDGRLNALINNAGISIKCDQGKRLNSFETEMSAWRQVFDINFFASVFLSRELKQELARTSGAIVNVTSIAGSRVHPFAGAAYATSKAELAA